MSVVRSTLGPQGHQALGDAALKIEYRTDSADNSQSELWTYETSHSFLLTRILTQRIGQRRRQHIIRLGIEGDDYQADYLEQEFSRASAFLQADWQELLLKFQNQPHEVIIGFATFDVESDAFGDDNLIPSTQLSSLLHFDRSLGLNFITEESGRTTWFEVPEENVPYMLITLDIGVRRIEDLGSVMEFRKYDRFQTLADFCKSKGREDPRRDHSHLHCQLPEGFHIGDTVAPRVAQSDVPKVHGGGQVQAVGTSFNKANFEIVRLKYGISVGSDFLTDVVLQIEPDNIHSKNGFAVAIQKDFLKLGYISEEENRMYFELLERVGGKAKCDARLWFAPPTNDPNRPSSAITLFCIPALTDKS
jgi:hypothetical protein